MTPDAAQVKLRPLIKPKVFRKMCPAPLMCIFFGLRLYKLSQPLLESNFPGAISKFRLKPELLLGIGVRRSACVM